MQDRQNSKLPLSWTLTCWISKQIDGCRSYWLQITFKFSMWPELSNGFAFTLVEEPLQAGSSTPTHLLAIPCLRPDQSRRHLHFDLRTRDSCFTIGDYYVSTILRTLASCLAGNMIGENGVSLSSGFSCERYVQGKQLFCYKYSLPYEVQR